MSGRALPYIGASGRRQIARLGAIALVAAALGGCARTGLPFADARPMTTTPTPMAYSGDVDPIMTSAVVRSDAEPTDWEAIRRTIDQAADTAARLDWNNAVTGSTGTIALAAEGEDCRAFAATINDTRGIRRYRGQACDIRGHAELRGLVADDAALL